MNLTLKTDLTSLLEWSRTTSEMQFHGFWLEWLMGDEAWGSLRIDLAITSVRQRLEDVSGLGLPAASALNPTFKSTTIYYDFSPGSHRFRACS